MKRFVILIVFGLAMCNFTSAQSPIVELDKVREIKLLESNRDDAIKLLAADSLDFSDSSDFHYLTFFTNNAVIKISYSSGKCSDESEDWNVLEQKVTKVTVIPKDSIQIKDIGIDYSKFRKEEIWGIIKNDYVYHDKSAGIAITTIGDRVETIIFTPSRKDYSLLCDKREVKKYYSSKKWNRYPELKDAILDSNYPANVTDLVLSQTEIIADCSLLNTAQDKNCTKSEKEISVSTTYADPENDVVTFNYYVSGGKILGRGANVVWDLSCEKAGTYTITAAVDDGCGLCGKFITETVIIKEYPNFRTK